MNSLRCRCPWWQVPVAFSLVATLVCLAGCVPAEPPAPPSVTAPQPAAEGIGDAQPAASDQEEPSLPPLPMEPEVSESPDVTQITTMPEEPTAEEPKVEEPKVEEPKVEEPKVEEPKVEEPKAEEPKAEEPKAEEPKAEEPKAEEPKAEEPKAEEPKAEEPKAEEAMPEEPKAEEPKAEEPKAEEPKAEEAMPEEPKAEEPKAEEPKAEEPKAEEPKAEEPKAEEAMPEEPKAEEPKAEEPKAEEPKAEEPKAEEAMPEEPKAEETVAIEAVTIDFITAPTPEWLPEPIEVENAAATKADEMKTYVEAIPDTEVTFQMVPIPGGKFVMGSPDGEEGRKDDEGPQVEVEIEPFWMGAHEVTWDEYELWALGLDKQRREMTKVAATQRNALVDAVAIPTKPYTDMTFGMGKEGYPAICMTQTAAKMFCKWLSAKTGRYYRLPTGAEWEYACRAGSSSAYCFGDGPEGLDEYAWYYENSDEKYQKVAQKKPNKWGLYDMHGNVAEWVLDQHTPDFYATLKAAGGALKNPFAEATKLYPRVVRGGSWDDDPEDLRSAARRGSTTDWMMQDPQIPQSPWYHTDADFVGFRVIRPLVVPTAEEAKRYELDEVQVTELEEYREAQAGKM